MGKSNSEKKRTILIILMVFIWAVSLTLPAVCAADKEMELRMASYIPVGYPYIYQGQKIFVDMVNEKGKGIVQINMYWSGSLLKAKALVPGLQAGTTDMIFHTSAYLLGSYPITGMLPEFLWTKNKLVRNPKDVKGLKIRVAGKVEAKVIQALGGLPVTLPSAELSQALQRGVVDGALIVPWTAKARGVEEFCKYLLMMPLTCNTTPIYIMLDKWNSWPENVRKILKECAVEWEIQYLSGDPNAHIHDSQLQTDLIPFYQKKGMKAVFITEEERKAFVDATKPVINWWVKQRLARVSV